MLNSQVNLVQGISERPFIQGIYGNYQITEDDEREVKRYRISLLICAISLSISILSFILAKPIFAIIFEVIMAISLGLSLQWIHIYIRPLHKALQILWAIGCVTIVGLYIYLGDTDVINKITSEPQLSIAFGPLFAAFTGLGFKEFFCFRRPEAIGLTILLPTAIMGYIIELFNQTTAITLMGIASLLLLILAIRKFGTDPGMDIGDKSVFEYINNLN